MTFPKTTLPDRKFVDLSGTREIAVSIPTDAELEEVESAWSTGRMPNTAHWNWPRIARESTEVFLIRDALHAPAALFTTARKKLLSAEGHRLYCVDFLEVAPECRGKGHWGQEALGVAATRALECGADGLALPALAVLEPWYAKVVGAVRGSKYAWKPGRDLVPMKIVGEAFEDLTEAIDGSQ